MAKDKPIRGRPKLEIDERFFPIIENLAREGHSVEYIANILNISKATLDRRISENPELSEALNLGRAQAAAKILNAAYEMAVSQKHPTMTIFWLKCKMGWREQKDDAQDTTKVYFMNYPRVKRESKDATSAGRLPEEIEGS